MIINPNNKDSILKGMVKRGFNQDPAELRAKLHPNAGKVNIFNNTKEKSPAPTTVKNSNLKETFNGLRRLKWK